MKSFKLHLVLGLFSLLLASSAFAVHIPKISGYINWGYTYDEDAAGVYVKICYDPTGMDLSTCRAPRTDINGYYYTTAWNVPDGAYLYFFPNIDLGTSPFTYGRKGMWGSPTVSVHRSKACQSQDQFGFCKNYGLNFSHFIYPSPLKPVAVNPFANQTDADVVQIMEWTNAADYDRQWAGITYDIYGSGYDVPLLLQVSDLPCNPNAAGNCTWELPITLDPQTPYNWKIVAKTSYGFPTESEVYHFTTGW